MGLHGSHHREVLLAVRECPNRPVSDRSRGRLSISTPALYNLKATEAGLAAQGYPVLTPEGNHSSIVTFEPGPRTDQIRSAFEEEKIKVSFKDGGRQIRAGAALFNNLDEIDALLGVTGRLSG